MKKLIIGIVVCVLASVGYLIVSNEKPMENNAVQTPSEQPANEPEQTNETTGRYAVYSEEDFAKTSGTRLLFFHAPWCPQCRALETSIESSGLPSELTIFKVDYDSNQALRQKYGVTIQTTVVKVDQGGNLIEKYVAYDDPTYRNVAANLITE